MSIYSSLRCAVLVFQRISPSSSDFSMVIISSCMPIPKRTYLKNQLRHRCMRVPVRTSLKRTNFRNFFFDFDSVHVFVRHSYSFFSYITAQSIFDKCDSQIQTRCRNQHSFHRTEAMMICHRACGCDVDEKASTDRREINRWRSV